MDGNILFTVLIANYNNAKYLETCLTSILIQTYSQWEIVFVDDCSTDNSMEIINRYADGCEKIKIFQNDKNYGAGYTKAKCVSFAEGSICGFVDPDDALMPNAIELMVAEHKKYPNAALISSQNYDCDEKMRPFKIQPKNQSSFNSMLETPHIVDHFATFKNDFYKKTQGIDPKMKRAIDMDLYLKLEETGEIRFIQMPLYIYRRNGNSISLGNNGYKATAWHVYAKINTCERRGLDFDQYCTILKPDKEYFEQKIRKFFSPFKRFLRILRFSIKNKSVVNLIKNISTRRNIEHK